MRERMGPDIATGSRRDVVLLAGLAALALLPRLWLVLGRTAGYGLGVDELQAATHAHLPLAQLLESLKAFSAHPPLYFLQLHVWMQLGTGDLWLQLNSVLWSLLAVISLFVASNRIYGRQAAFWAAVLLALSPFSVAYASSVRMYSFLMFLGVWSWFFTHQFFFTERTLLAGVGLVLSSLAFLYSHGASFLILGSMWCYALILIVEQESRRYIVRWVVVQFAILLLYAPWLLQARSMQRRHLLTPGFEDVAYTFAQLLFGIKVVLSKYVDSILILSLLFVVILSIVSLFGRNSRRVVVSFVIVPIVACFLVSYLVRPIWLTRTLAYVAPFLCLGLVLSVAGLQGKVPGGRRVLKYIVVAASWVLFLVLGFGSIAALIFQYQVYDRWWHLKEAAELVRLSAEDSDVVYVPNERVFWGWNWYFVGPGSVNPLETDYSIAPGDRPRIVSRPAVQSTIGPGQTFWLVYRARDGTEPFDSYGEQMTREMVKIYRNVFVERVRVGQTEGQ